jgi:uncharacterized membrane protein
MQFRARFAATRATQAAFRRKALAASPPGWNSSLHRSTPLPLGRKEPTMSAALTPLIAVHATAAIAATLVGPFAIWARKARTQRPRLHRAAGYAWVTLMLITAISAIFISDPVFPRWVLGSMGFSAIHLLIPVTLGMMGLAFWFLFRGNLRGHRLSMVNLYLGACLVAGFFTLAPNRLLGQALRNLI